MFSSRQDYYSILKKYNFVKSNVINMNPLTTTWFKDDIKIEIINDGCTIKMI